MSTVSGTLHCTFPLCRPPRLHFNNTVHFPMSPSHVTCPYVAYQWHITLYISIMLPSGIFQNHSNFIISYHTQFSSKSQMYWHIRVLGHVTGAKYHIHFIIPPNLHHQTYTYVLLMFRNVSKQEQLPHVKSYAILKQITKSWIYSCSSIRDRS